MLQYRGNALLKVYRETPAKLVRLVRKNQDMTQVEMSSKLGIDRSVLSRYETGEYMPPGDIIVRCLRLLGIDLVEMVVEDLEAKLILAQKAAKMMMKLAKQGKPHTAMEETLVRGLRNVPRDDLQTIMTDLRKQLGLE